MHLSLTYYENQFIFYWCPLTQPILNKCDISGHFSSMKPNLEKSDSGKIGPTKDKSDILMSGKQINVSTDKIVMASLLNTTFLVADYINNCITSSKDSSCKKKKDCQILISKTVNIFHDPLSMESGEFRSVSRTIATASVISS